MNTRSLKLSMTLKAFLLVLVSLASAETMVEKATKEGVLLMGNGGEPKSLDPHLVNGVSEGNVLRALFEGLCIEHPSDDSVSLPGAAASWTANADFTEWIFKLQPEGKWSDGEQVTSHDFHFAYNRILNPDFPAGYRGMLYFIKNAEAYSKGEVKDFSAVGVEVVDDLTLKITLKAPTPFLPSLTKHWTWYPLPKHKVLEFGEMTEPFTAWTSEKEMVGNGPFKLNKFRLNHFIEVGRNAHYWEPDKVQLKGIRFFPITNKNTETRMFLNDQLHVSHSMPSDFIPKALKEYADKCRQETYIATRIMRANVNREFTGKLKVRQALSLCIDRQSIVDNIMQGGEKPAGTITPPFGAYQPAFKTGFDPQRAKQLMAEAGYDTPDKYPQIGMLIYEDDTNRFRAEAIKSAWEEHLGLEVDIVLREGKSYYKMRSEQNYDLIDGSWTGDYLDPTTFLDLWKGTNGNNYTGWSNEKYEELLEAAEVIEDPKARYAKLLEAESLLMDHVPVIPLYHYNTNYFISPSVKNWHPLLLNTRSYKFIELKK